MSRLQEPQKQLARAMPGAESSWELLVRAFAGHSDLGITQAAWGLEGVDDGSFLSVDSDCSHGGQLKCASLLLSPWRRLPDEPHRLGRAGHGADPLMLRGG